MDGMASSTRAYWRTKAARCPELLADLPSDEAEREYHDLDSTRYYLKSVARWLLTAIAAGLVLGPGPLPGSLCDSTWPLNMFPADDGVREWAEVALRDGYVDWGRGAAELRRANVALFLSRASGRGEDWELFGAAHPQHPGWRRSALLSAARGGDAELLLFLLARGVAADTVDVWGRGVLHYLALRGAAPPQELLEVLGAAEPKADHFGLTPEAIAAALRDPPPSLPRPLPDAPADNGGWPTGGAPREDAPWWLREGLREGCDIAEVHWPELDGGSAAWLRQFAVLQRPVILRGVLDAAHPLRRLLSRGELTGRFGAARVWVAEIPYASAYTGARARTMRLRDALGPGADSAIDYVFDTLGMGTEARSLRQELRESLPPPLSDFPNATLQLWAGDRGSGAPYHVHEDAINVAAYGRKLWFMYPPGEGVWTAEPMAEWLGPRASSAGGPGGAHGKPQRCVQRAGDALYVPSGWAHGVVNLEFGVGIAAEFAESTDLAELWPWVGK